jgi:hypothetical protein
MHACVILHNMIVEDEREVDLSKVRIAEIVVESVEEDQTISGVELSDEERFKALQRWHTRVRDRQGHHNLRNDLIEHIWCLFGQNRLENIN